MSEQAAPVTASLREMPGRPSLPLLGDTLSFVRDPAGFLQSRAAELGPVFRVSVFGHPTACFVGPDAFSIVLDDNNAVRAGANPPHIEELFDPQAVPFLDAAAHRRRKRLLMQAFVPEALDGYLPIVERVMARYVDRWAKLRLFSFVPELTSLGFTTAAALFLGAAPDTDHRTIERSFADFAKALLSLPIRLPFTPFT